MDGNILPHRFWEAMSYVVMTTWNCSSFNPLSRTGNLQYTLQPTGGSESRRACTWTPGVEQQVQVGVGVLFGSLHAVGHWYGHIRPIHPHNSFGVRYDTERHDISLHAQYLARPQTATAVTEGHYHMGAPVGWGVSTWGIANRERAKVN